MAGVDSILLVHGTKEEAAWIGKFLEKHEFPYSWVQSGAAALDGMRFQKPSLVISDVALADMDGFELSRRIRSFDSLKSLPVILLNVRPEAMEIASAVESGVDSILTRPYNLLQLLNCIRSTTQAEQAGDVLQIKFRGQKQPIPRRRLQLLERLLATYDESAARELALVRENASLRERSKFLEARMAENSAALAGATEDHERLYNAVKEELNSCKSLYDTVESLMAGDSGVLASGDSRSAGSAIFEACKRLTGAKAGYISLAGGEGEPDEEVIYQTGTPERTGEQPAPISVDGIGQKARLSRAAVYSNSYGDSKWGQALPGHAQVDSLLCAPIVVKGRPSGLIALANKPGGFTDRDAQMAQALGQLAGVAFSKHLAIQELEKSEEHFRSVVQASADAIITTDGGGKIVFWNKAAERLFGYPADQVMGLPVSVVIPERFRRNYFSGMGATGSATAPVDGVLKHAEEYGLKSDGFEFPVELSVASWATNSGRFFTAVAHDISARKQTEAQLRESEERYRSLVDYSPDMIVVHCEGKVVLINPAGLRLLGSADAVQVVGKSLLGFVHPSHRKRVVDRFQRPIEQMMATGQMLPSVEEKLVRLDGTEVDVEVTATPFTFQGKSAMQLHVRDITDHKRADRALEASELRYRTIVETADEGIWILDPQDRITFANARAASIRGFTLDEMLGKPALDFIDDESRALVASNLERRRQGIKESFDRRIRRKDGTQRWIRVSAKPFVVANGDYAGDVVMFADITERKQAEQALSESEARYRSLFQNMLNGFAYNEIVLDGHGRPVDFIFLEANEAFESMTGLKRESIIGRRVTEVIPGIETAEFDWIGTYGMVALTGQQVSFEQYQEQLGRWYSMVAYRPREGHFAVIFWDITDQKRAAEALRESQERYRLIVETSEEGIWLIDPQDRIVFSNSKSLEVIGYSTDELLGKPVLDVVDDQIRDLISSKLERRRQGVKETYDSRLRCKDGTYRWILVCASPWVDTNGNYGGSIVMFTDITERKQAEQALSESEQRYRDLTDSLPETVFEMDMAGRLTFANISALEHFGYSQEEFDGGINMGDVLAPQEQERALSDFVTTLNSQAPVSSEYTAIRKNGTTFPALVYASAIKKDGLRIGLRGILVDISDRKRAEEAVHESEERYRRIVETTSEGVWILDAADRVAYANNTMVKMLGYALKEMVGKPVVQFVDEESHRVVGMKLDRRHQGEKDTYDVRMIRDDGDRMWVSASATPIFTQDGQYGGSLTMLTDITKRKEAEEALRESEQRYRIIVETAEEGIWLVDGENRTLFANCKLADMLGYTLNDMLGKSLFDFMEADQRDVAASRMEELHKGVAVRRDFRFRRRDGSDLWAIVSVSTLFDEDGRYAGSFGMVTDITERRLAEAAALHNLNMAHRTVEGMIDVMARTIELKDPFTAGHQRRTAALATAIAIEMGLSAEGIQAVKVASSIHDLGNIGIPSDILTRPGRLSAAEMDLIRSHSQLGRDILSTVEFPWPVAEIVHQHHERMDGSGYPRRLSGTDMLPEARILAVADVVEAMSSHRPYRPSLGVPPALAEITKNRAILYDSSVVDACLRLITEQGFIFPRDIDDLARSA